MTLLVPYEQFPDAVKRVLDTAIAYVSAHGESTVVSAYSATGATVVKSTVHAPIEDVRKTLKKSGMETFDGMWAADDAPLAESNSGAAVHIAAVAYASGEDKPGVWVDAYSAAPTQVQVLKAMFEEFRETGELDDVTFEEFVRLANPNVVVVTPSEIENFVAQKEPC
jgi:hypothetical protein